MGTIAYLVLTFFSSHLLLEVLTQEIRLLEEDNSNVISNPCGESVSNEVKCSVNDTCVESNEIRLDGAHNCPVWFYCKAGKCTCYPNYGDIVLCNAKQQKASVVDCYCVTYDHKNKDFVVGHCEDTCASPHHKDLVDNVYHQLPQNSIHFNEKVCEGSSRTGVLCGKCKNGTYPLVYSYSHSCIPSHKCGTISMEVIKYIFAAYGPLTIFYFIVLLFQINVTSSFLHGFCLISQALTIPMQVRAILSAISSRKILSKVVKGLVSILAIWNLDFFRGMYTESICFPIPPMAVTALNYGVAIYPLVLSIVSYYLIKLYDRKIQLIVYLWKPIQYLLSIFQNKWNRNTSVVDAYATFFLLSYMKVLESSMNLLVPAVLQYQSSNLTRTVLFYDGTVEYFGREHLPYAFLATFFFMVVNIFPIIVLLFYQCKCFQMILSKLSLRLDVVHTFMDLLQGCYKNGATPHTRDLRWFSAVFLICRFMLFIVLAMTLNAMVYVFGTLVGLVTQALIMLIQPFKNTFSHFAWLNSAFIISLVLTYISFIGINIVAVVETGGIIFEFYFVSVATVLFPIIYISMHTCYWIVINCQVFRA